MATDDSTTPRAQYHIGRARLLLDLLSDSERGKAVAATLRVISAELEEATKALDGTAQPQRMLFHVPTDGPVDD
jgi:hypothetical protein